ncbi:MAG TPA: metallophosphoesterase [Syntrophomonadaceae bacterium]|nr:metallophosphoesterase [Syntrophomonadaceae bacterium]
MKNIITWVFILLIALIFISIFASKYIIQVSTYNITSNKIPSAFNHFKILQISDLHSNTFGLDNINLIKKVEKINPDIVVMTGDMVDTTDTDFDVFINLATVLSEKYDVFFIMGNHEQNLVTQKRKFLIEQLKETGITVLDNEFVAIDREQETIHLYGMWFNLRYYRNLTDKSAEDIQFTPEKMKTILGECDESIYNILLTHNPLYFNTYADWGSDLTLAGHVHGGMIRIPFIGGLLSPERNLFPKYSAGHYEIGNKNLIVNRGLGNGGFGIRVFNNPEISVIILETQ